MEPVYKLIPITEDPKSYPPIGMPVYVLGDNDFISVYSWTGDGWNSKTDTSNAGILGWLCPNPTCGDQIIFSTQEGTVDASNSARLIPGVIIQAWPSGHSLANIRLFVDNLETPTTLRRSVAYSAEPKPNTWRFKQAPVGGINYQELLRKYINHIQKQEGTDFILSCGGDPVLHDPLFTKAEVQELNRLAGQ